MPSALFLILQACNLQSSASLCSIPRKTSIGTNLVLALQAETRHIVAEHVAAEALAARQGLWMGSVSQLLSVCMRVNTCCAGLGCLLLTAVHRGCTGEELLSFFQVLNTLLS